jgi:hypothetical protein
MPKGYTRQAIQDLAIVTGTTDPAWLQGMPCVTPTTAAPPT